MSFTYKITNRFFIQNPYGEKFPTDNIPFTADKILDFLSDIDRNQYDNDGLIILRESSLEGKYQYDVIGFPHQIWTPTGKFKKSFKESLAPSE
tara:strand:+ start:49 stop:327 length:279 start_codon:yes stop_codon:yes gene_type:complete